MSFGTSYFRISQGLTDFCKLVLCFAEMFRILSGVLRGKKAHIMESSSGQVLISLSSESDILFRSLKNDVALRIPFS